ncbi:DMT family transporter [Pseudomonas sp. NPDC089401]|uniref:DMT family transporter n=1 Tax=Pseudomonas sp. NPDC089401 TaxID=3364462 RepID=UPI00380E172C
MRPFDHFAVCALGAAALNGLIGPLTKIALLHGLNAPQIAFSKALIAFVLLLGFCLASGRRRDLRETGKSWAKLAVLALLGIFSLYYFETQAFAEASVSLVSFLTYAAGGFSILLAAVFLRERLGLLKVLSFLAIVAGVLLLLGAGSEMSGSMKGATLALLGGLGYALFIFFAKYSNAGSGLVQLTWLFGFGSLYLLPPAWLAGFSVPSVEGGLALLGLVLLPTIGGFYLTTRAIALGEAGRVQIIETSDPLFATLFAFLMFGEVLNLSGVWGAAFILSGLLLSLFAGSVDKPLETACEQAKP